MSSAYRPIEQHCFNKEPKYKFLSLIGNGSFGCVYKARDLERELDVAVKRSMKVGSLISREFKILKEISSHPNCVQLLDIFYTVDKDQRFVQNLVFEFLPESLDKYIRRRYKAKIPFTPTEVRDIMRQILSGLEFLHDKEIIHRDLKPENILLNTLEAPPTVKLCDFGSSKKLSSLNTPYIVSRFYRAPELIFCNTKYGSEIDIWAAGCIFAELYFGQPVFVGENEGNQFIKQAELLGPPSLSACARLFENTEIDPSAAARATQIPKKYSLKTIFERDSNPDEALDLACKMLEWDPTLRITAKDCLTHPYFQNYVK
jgi:glycogen synthase kinase 3 beta